MSLTAPKPVIPAPPPPPAPKPEPTALEIGDSKLVTSKKKAKRLDLRVPNIEQSLSIPTISDNKYV